MTGCTRLHVPLPPSPRCSHDPPAPHPHLARPRQLPLVPLARAPRAGAAGATGPPPRLRGACRQVPLARLRAGGAGRPPRGARGRRRRLPGARPLADRPARGAVAGPAIGAPDRGRARPAPGLADRHPAPGRRPRGADRPRHCLQRPDVGLRRHPDDRRRARRGGPRRHPLLGAPRAGDHGGQRPGPAGPAATPGLITTRRNTSSRNSCPISDSPAGRRGGMRACRC
jgi:hypothetical protein